MDNTGDSRRSLSELGGTHGRRTFLTVGAAAVGSALLAACSFTGKKQLAQTGSIPTTLASDASTTTIPGSKDNDLLVLRTLGSLEALALQAYQKGLATNLVKTVNTVAMLNMFLDQHTQAAALVSQTTSQAGGAPYTTPNPYLENTIVAPDLLTAKNENDVLVMVTAVEVVLNGTYITGGGTLTTPALRSFANSLSAVDSRHMTVLYGIQGLNPVPLPTGSANSGAPLVAYIGPNGPLREPPPVTTAAAS